jgi:hypothetical protein|tara:strand:- start:295 stop:480 length:186 start_codon:yes stop_codon:yes gene_type:complete
MTSTIAKMQQIVIDCNRRILEIKESQAWKELQALERQKQYTNEKLIKATGIGNTEENKEVN